MNLFNRKILIVSLLFGITAFAVLYSEIFFTIPGTSLLSDPREIFVTIGAAITGPIGGVLIGILSSIYDPTKELVFYITFQHIIGAFFTALFYKKLVYEKLAMPAFILGWGLLMFCYYFVFYLPGFTFVYFFFPGFYKLIVQGEYSFFDSLIRIFNGWIPEFLFTTILTSLIFIGLPEKFRKPLWGKSLSRRPKGVSIFNNSFFDFGRLKNFLAIRLVIWFLVLAVIPILFIGVSIKKEVTNSILEHEAIMREAMANGYKQRLIDLPVKESIKFLKQAQLALEGSLFIIDGSGKYQLVSDTTKDRQDARIEYGDSIINQILQLKDGKLIDNANLISFGFATFVTKPHELTIIVTSNVKRIQTISAKFESSVYKKLGLGIMLISITLILIIFVLIRIPLSNLTKAIDKFGAGDYNAHISEEKLYDEIKVLASSFNLMAQKITTSNRNLETEISERKEVEKELSESELRWKFALEGAGDGIWDWNIVTDEVYFSPQWKRMIGFEENEIPNKLNEWKNRVHPEDLETCLHEIQEHFDQQTKFYENEHRLLCKDGSYKWILDRGIAIERDVNGKPLRMIGTHRDISKRKKDEQIQSAIFEITEASLDSENITEFYTKIHRLISRLMYAENLFIAILNKKENLISFPYYKDQFDERPSSHVPGNGLTEYLFREDKIQLIREDVFNQLVSNREVELDGSPSVDWLGAPFRIDEYLSGAIVVQSYDEKIRLGQNELELLNLISTQISAAIHRKMSEEALKESEIRFKKLFEDSSEPIILLKNGYFMEYNQAAIHILGFDSKEELISKTPWDLSPEFQPDGNPSVQKAEEMINLAIQNGSHTFEWVHKRKDGTNFYVEVALSPIVLHGEELIHVTWRDLTQRKLAQEELIASEKKFREMTDLLPQIVFETDLTGCITFVNRVSFDVFGYAQEDLNRGVNVLEVLAAEEHPRAMENINDILRGKVNTGNEYIGLKKDGTRVPVLIYTNPIIKEGKPVGLRGIVIDITENKKAEEEILKVKTQLQNVLNAATEVSIIATNEEGIITLFNSGAEKMLCYNAEEVIGKCTPLCFHLDEELKLKADELFVEHDVSVEGFEVFIFKARIFNSEVQEWTYIRKDGLKIRVNLVVTAVKNQNNQITGYLGIATDITKRKEAEIALSQSEERFRSLVQGLNDSISIVDSNGIIIYQSPSSERLIGYKPIEMIGHNCLEYVYHEDIELIQKEFELLVNLKSDAIPTLYRIQKKNGGITYVDAIGLNLLHVPSVNGIALFVRDVNDEVIAKKLLQESESRYRLTIEQTGQIVYDIDLINSEVNWSGAIQKLTGFSLEEFSVKSGAIWDEILYHEDREKTILFFDDIIEKQGNYSIQYRIVKKNGEIIYIEDSGIVIGDEKGIPIRMLGTFKDITQNVQTLQEVNQSSENFNTVFKTSPIPQVITLIEKDSTIIEVNEAFIEYTQYSRDELIGFPSSLVSGTDVESKIRDIFHREGFVENFEATSVFSDGTTRTYLISSRVIEFNKKPATLTTLKDITEIRNTESKLKAAFEYIQYVVDSISISIISVNRNLILTHYNKSAEVFRTDNSKKSGNIFEVFPKLRFIEEDLEQAIIADDAIMNSNMLIDEHSITRYYSIAIFPLKSGKDNDLVIMIEDTTDKTRFSEIMIQSEKMITVAGLAAGMAHEINNPLGTIVQGCQNILRRVSTSIPKNLETADKLGIQISNLEQYFHERQIFEIIDSMRTAASKASEIIKNMLQFSRRSESKKVEAQISKIIDEAIELAYNDYDLKKRYDFRSIELLKEIEVNLPILKLTVTEIEQVLFNIIKNAAQAFANEHDLTKHPKLIVRAMKDGRFVRIEIEDNGPGIQDKIKNRIFEPFFTTKDVGEGTGLGLSVSYMIIRDNHRGELYCESKLGFGTKFIIKLPFKTEVVE